MKDTASTPYECAAATEAGGLAASVQSASGRKGWVFALLMFALSVATFQLGQWQTRRGDYKAQLEAQRQSALAQAVISPTSAHMDAQALQYRRLSLTGRFLPGTQVFLDNRQVQGLPAVEVIEGFRVEPAGFVVPLSRGVWPRDVRQARSDPVVSTPEGLLTVQALLMPHFPRAAELWGLRVSDASEVHKTGRLWSNFDPKAYGVWVEHTQAGPLADFVALQLPDELLRPDGQGTTEGMQAASAAGPSKGADGLYRSVPRFESEVDKHRGYAFQWFSMTLLLWVGALYMVYRDWKGRHEQ